MNSAENAALGNASTQVYVPKQILAHLLLHKELHKQCSVMLRSYAAFVNLRALELPSQKSIDAWTLNSKDPTVLL